MANDTSVATNLDAVVKQDFCSGFLLIMIEPKTASRYLTIYELRAASPEQAVQRMDAARISLRDAALEQHSFAESGSTMFRKIRDVRRP